MVKLKERTRKRRRTVKKERRRNKYTNHNSIKNVEKDKKRYKSK
jgi:hypothetical protein